MRNNSISPEFIYNSVNGTLSMYEKKSFIGSKAIKISNNINIDSNNIIYYQNTNNEQIDIDTEMVLDSNIYDIIKDKLYYSVLELDNSQTEQQKDKNTKWLLKINVNNLLNNYIFYAMKKHRTFEGVQNNMVLSKDVNSAIKEYISLNILDRYTFDRIDLFINYNELNNKNLRFKNNWDQKIENNINIFKNYSKNISNNLLEISFNQENPSKSHSFNYYYNLYFTKI
jgi:hypothetical protein